MVALPSKKIRVLDVPGHPRVRDQFRDHLKHAKAIAFVVDASTISRNGAAVAEYVTSQHINPASLRRTDTCTKSYMH
jgi:signal recognition particle receptor subunit beta